MDDVSLRILCDPWRDAVRSLTERGSTPDDDRECSGGADM